MASVAFTKDQGHRGAIAVWAETSTSVDSLSTTLDQEAAIAIYLAKASRTPRDSTSATLATRYNITMKAVRDVWNLRCVWGRFITNRSARASKDHHGIFGLQTSSHSPGPRCVTRQ